MPETSVYVGTVNLQNQLIALKQDSVRKSRTRNGSKSWYSANCAGSGCSLHNVNDQVPIGAQTKERR